MQFRTHSALFIKHFSCYSLGCYLNTSLLFLHSPLSTTDVLLLEGPSQPASQPEPNRWKVITRQQGFRLRWQSFLALALARPAHQGYASSWRQDESSASPVHSAPSGNVAAFSRTINFYLADAIVSSKWEGAGAWGMGNGACCWSVAITIMHLLILLRFLRFSFLRSIFCIYTPISKLFVFITNILAALSFFSAGRQRCPPSATYTTFHSIHWQKPLAETTGRPQIKQMKGTFNYKISNSAVMGGVGTGRCSVAPGEAMVLLSWSWSWRRGGALNT